MGHRSRHTIVTASDGSVAHWFGICSAVRQSFRPGRAHHCMRQGHRRLRECAANTKTCCVIQLLHLGHQAAHVDAGVHQPVQPACPHVDAGLAKPLRVSLALIAQGIVRVDDDGCGGQAFDTLGAACQSACKFASRLTVTFDSNAREKIFEPGDRNWGLVRDAIVSGHIEGLDERKRRQQPCARG
jgi:hypothetical protein